jgi:hypothetical protein
VKHSEPADTIVRYPYQVPGTYGLGMVLMPSASCFAIGGYPFTQLSPELQPHIGCFLCNTPR